MMALNRNNSFCRVCDLPIAVSPTVMWRFRNPPPPCPGRRASARVSEVVSPRAHFKASAGESGAECFIALEADFLNSFIAYIS